MLARFVAEVGGAFDACGGQHRTLRNWMLIWRPSPRRVEEDAADAVAVPGEGSKCREVGNGESGVATGGDDSVRETAG